MIQKQKSIEEEQKLYPKINPKLLSNNQPDSSSHAIEPAVVNVQTIKVTKKARHKPHSVKPEMTPEDEEKSNVKSSKNLSKNSVSFSEAN